MTTFMFETVIEGMMDQRKEPEKDANPEEHPDKRGEEEQAQRIKELMDGNFRTGDAVSHIIQRFLRFCLRCIDMLSRSGPDSRI
jgi:hypothetical protein